MPKRRSITQFLYGQVLAILLSIIVMFVAVNWVTTNILRDEASKQGALVANSLEAIIQARAADIAAKVHEIRSLNDGTGLRTRHLDQYLDDLWEADDAIRAIEILDSSGKVINAAPSDITSVNMDRSAEDYIERAQVPGRLYWSSIVSYVQTGEPVIAATLREDNFYYVVYLDLKGFSRIVSDYSKNLSEYIELVVVDEYGTFISTSDASLVSQRARSAQFTEIQSSIKSKTYAFESDDENSYVYTSYLRMFRWYVATYSDKTHILRAVTAVNRMFLVLLGIVVIGGTIYYRGARRISNSILEFSHTANNIASGRYDLNVDGQDMRELATLGQNLSSMATQLKYKNHQLHERAYVDILTGLPNRRAALERLSALVGEGTSFTLYYFDLDRFKELNDKLGHHIGDQLLNAVGKRITKLVDQESRLYRVGGDEFIYILPEIDGLNNENHLEDIIREINQPFSVQGHILDIGSSVGSARYPYDASSVQDLLKYADVAMYAAKSEGGNRVQRFTTEMHDAFMRKTAIESVLTGPELYDVLGYNLQPQFNIRTGEVIGFEILARFYHPELGNVPPDEFIANAENRGVIHKITLWIFEKAFESVSWLSRVHDTNYRISINISASDLLMPSVVDRLYELMDQYQMDPRDVEVEITETVLIEEFDAVNPVLEKLEQSGVRIGLDDFGKGYSSLSYFNEMAIDTLKIDKRFIDSAIAKPKSEMLLRVMIAMATQLGAEVIAEGIETAEQLSLLHGMNCFGAQGYYLARPMTFEALDEFLHGYAPSQLWRGQDLGE